MATRAIVFVLMVSVIGAPVLDARDRDIRRVEIDRGKMRAYNVGLTAFFTLVTAIVQGEVDSPRDAMRHFLIGSGAGFSFYQAKRMAGAGRTTQGWILTNVTTTVVENTSSGEHPIGRIGYTVGPLRLRVATPWARRAAARIEADWSLAETAALFQALREGDHVQSRDGLIAIDRDTGWPDPDREHVVFIGRTYGVFPGVISGTSDTVWNHEVVHAVQHQQLDSVEPPVYTFGGDAPSKPRRVFMFRHVRLGFTHIANLVTYRRPYEERWIEVEAYGLAEREPVH